MPSEESSTLKLYFATNPSRDPEAVGPKVTLYQSSSDVGVGVVRILWMLKSGLMD